MLVLNSMKVHSVNVRSKSNTLAQHLHLDEVKRADTFSFPKWRERATMDEVPLNMEMAPVNQQTIGEMELVPSAVGPNEIEQRCRIAKVRTLQKVWSPEARNPFLVLWGRVIDKRARPAGFNSLKPSPHCPPSAKDKKALDLQDPLSASVRAQAGHPGVHSFFIHNS